jgi:hypothetical protein
MRPLQKTLASSSATTGSPTTSGGISSEAAVKSGRALHSGTHSSQVTIKTWRQCLTGVAFLQMTEEQTKNAILTSPEFFTVQNDYTFTLGLSLLNWHVKFSMRQGSLAPSSFSFQLPRVISLFNGGRGFGESVQRAFGDDNLEEVHELFRGGLLTPATIISSYDYDPDYETSLLGVRFSQLSYNASSNEQTVSGPDKGESPP